MSRSRLLPAALLFGYAFLYVPVLLLVATSFNPSRLTTVLSGFSWRWYAALWANEKLIDAALLSLRIAALSATGATVLGTMALAIVAGDLAKSAARISLRSRKTRTPGSASARLKSAMAT